MVACALPRAVQMNSKLAHQRRDSERRSFDSFRAPSAKFSYEPALATLHTRSGEIGSSVGHLVTLKASCHTKLLRYLTSTSIWTEANFAESPALATY